MEVVAEGLRFPEGPVALPDGSVLVVELAAGVLSRVEPGGEVDEIAQLGGGPNGAAIGPDGRVYICNNGGFDDATDPAGFFAAMGMPREYKGGSIQSVDLDTAEVRTVYTECDGYHLSGPNDIVFDAAGGFWFTDLGKSWPRRHDHGGLYYGHVEGSHISEVVYPLITPNGVALSPDGSSLYVSETDTGRLYRWAVTAPGVLDLSTGRVARGDLVFSLGDTRRFDSMAVDSAGHVCVATLGSGGGISDISPDGSCTLVATDDPLTTNVCFGGPDLQTAFITCSRSGTLRSLPWPRPGIPLHY